MTDLFLKVFNMSISASWLIAVVLVLRIIFTKVPKRVRMLLWAIVAVRLICPVSLESVLSLIPSTETISPEIIMSPQPEIYSGVPVIDNAVNPVISHSFAPEVGDSANPLQIWISVVSVIWVMGILVLLAYAVISYWKLSRRMHTAVLLQENIYQSENTTFPFVMGILQPKVYLPFKLDEQEMGYVIAHERAHIKRRDYWWKPLGFLLMTVYWFNPLMWIAYILFCRDIELACDETVVNVMEDEDKAAYAQALLNCSIPRRMDVLCPLAFGEVGVKQRIKSILNYKKPAFWIMVSAIVICIVVAVCFLTNPKSDESVKESVETEDIEIEEVETKDTLDVEDDTESGSETSTYQNRYEEYLACVGEARDYIAGKLPNTDISDAELPEGVHLFDICEGDLDGDGKQDFAVVLEYEPGYEYFDTSEGIRPIYVYTYAEGAGYQCRYEHHSIILADGTGGMLGDPYAGISIKEGTLRISDYGGSAFRWADDLIFEIKGGELVLKEYINSEESTHSGNGIQCIWKYEEGTFETYTVAQTAEMLLVNRGTFEARTIPFQEATLSELRGIAEIVELPDLGFDRGRYDYKGLLDGVEKNAARYTAEEALDIVKEEHYSDMHRVNIVCEEEIFNNYETLLGYEPPRYYYEDDEGNKLTYISQEMTAGHTHEIGYWEAESSYYDLPRSYIVFDTTGEIK